VSPEAKVYSATSYIVIQPHQDKDSDDDVDNNLNNLRDARYLIDAPGDQSYDTQQNKEQE
jgi:hypothetical protein